MARVKISAAELELGTPLEFRVYSAAGKLLLSEGNQLRSDAQRERLLALGAFRDADAIRAPGRCADDGMLLSTATHAMAERPSLHLVESRFPTSFTSVERFHLSVAGAQEVSFPAQYVGAVEDHALLVTVEGDGAALNVGMAVDAKVIWGRDICAFKTRIAARDTRLPSLIHLEYPAIIRRQTIRRHVRIGVDFSARLLRNDLVATGFDAKVTDLCASGIGFYLPDASLHVGEHFKIALRIALEGRTHAIMLNCVVRSVLQKGDGLKVGAEFGAVSEDIRRTVQAYLLQQVTDGA